VAHLIRSTHPELPVDPQKVEIAALLHDIGRAFPGDHEINTIQILNKEGLADIAEITMHGSYYEIMLLRGIDDQKLKPTTLENKIVAYADSRFKDKLISMEERWSEIETRRSDEPQKIKSLQMAKNRFKEIEREILGLIDDCTDLQ